MAASPLVVFFKDIDKDDIPLVGGKGANLGEMVSAGFPVPNGFAVTVRAYDLFLQENELFGKVSSILKDTDVEVTDKLEASSRKIQKLITTNKIPDEVSKETVKAYKRLSGFLEQASVAVRSSATAEDLPSASFAGQQASFMNVKGEANLLIHVRECWASLFTARAIFYRKENNIPHDKVKISVIVQKMIQSKASGVMFTIDPVTNQKDRFVIEAIWGLGDAIVQGIVVPDRYIVQKDTFAILSKEVSDQRIMLVKDQKGIRQVDVAPKDRETQKVTNEEIVELAKIGDRLQKHYYFPQDIEWAKEKNKLYITQTRPVTTLLEVKQKTSNVEESGYKLASTPILSGTPASPGIGGGFVKILKGPKEIGRLKSGDVLVTKMTSPDFVPAMKKASAIVTDEGGKTSHAAIVSRELGIPCVVGTKEATTKLREEMAVTVNGTTGEIFMGDKIVLKEARLVEEKPVHIKTATKLYVNLAEKDRAKKIAKEFVDGVGLLRAEFMIADLGIHPKEAIKRKTQTKFIDNLAFDISGFCRVFYPRPVIYRTTDFKTNEYRALPGGKSWEPEEPNPMLGYRGAFRYVADPEVFNLELSALKKVRNHFDNLWIMIPYVRSPSELAKVRRLVATEGFFESPSFKFWMMVELPVNVILLEDFIDVGIDGVSIGSNDLTMLLQGTDRDNTDVASSFNERAKEVSWALRRVIKICNKRGISSSICGQAPSVYDDLVSELVKLGITSISVNPDAINRVRRVIMETERSI